MTTDSHRRKHKHHHHRQLDMIQYDPASYILRRFLESIFFAVPEQTVARKEREHRSSIQTRRTSFTGNQHGWRKGRKKIRLRRPPRNLQRKERKTTKERRKNKQTNRRGFPPQSMQSQKTRKIVKRRRTTTTTRLHKKASNKKTEKELARKIQTKRRQRSCKDGLRKKNLLQFFHKNKQQDFNDKQQEGGGISRSRASTDKLQESGIQMTRATSWKLIQK